MKVTQWVVGVHFKTDQFQHYFESKLGRKGRSREGRGQVVQKEPTNWRKLGLNAVAGLKGH